MHTVVEYARMQKSKFTPFHVDLLERAQKEHDAVCGEGDWQKGMK